jgi:peptide/nickel transport system permease protein
MAVERESDMQRYILQRVFYALISLVILSITIFCLIRFTGDPAVLMVEPGASDADLQMIRKEFGLDKSLPVQYVRFIANPLSTSIYNVCRRPYGSRQWPCPSRW